MYPVGTVKDSLQMARGYWEAKDTLDNMDWQGATGGRGAEENARVGWFLRMNLAGSAYIY